MRKISFKTGLSKYIHSILDFIYPRFCTCCNNRLAVNEQILCAKCLLNLPRYPASSFEENELTRLFWGLIPIVRGTALFYYTKNSIYSRILTSLKYAKHPEIGVYMGRVMAEEFKHHHFFDGIDLIIPIPLTKEKEKQREYNQSEQIAIGISEMTQIKVSTNSVARIRHTASQTSLTSHERIESVRGAFKVIRPHELAGKHILLVDDVATTGATLLACAEAIAEQHQTKISIATLARTHY